MKYQNFKYLYHLTVMSNLKLAYSNCLPIRHACGTVCISAGIVRARWLNIEELPSATNCVTREAVRLAILSADNPLPETSTPCAI